MAHEQAVRQGTSVTIEIRVSGEEPPDNVTRHYRIARRANGPSLVEVDDPQIQSEVAGSDTVYSVPLTVAQTSGLGAGSYYHELYEVSNGVRNVLFPIPGHPAPLSVLRALVLLHD